jgi:NADH-quinone oxidoreductase subunit N
MWEGLVSFFDFICYHNDLQSPPCAISDYIEAYFRKFFIVYFSINLHMFLSGIEYNSGTRICMEPLWHEPYGYAITPLDSVATNIVIINLIILITIIGFIGFFLFKKPKLISTLNVLVAFVLFIYVCTIPLVYNVITIPFIYLFILCSSLHLISFLIINNKITFTRDNLQIEYPLLILFLFLSSIILIIANNWVLILISLEAITFIVAVLVAFQRNHYFTSSVAIRYMLFSAIPSGILILGIIEFYIYFGTFNLFDIAKLQLLNNSNIVLSESKIFFIQESMDMAYSISLIEFYNLENIKVIEMDYNPLLLLNYSNEIPLIITIAFCMIIFNILFKLTAAPFHFWAPLVYEGAPLVVAMVLSIFTKITMIFFLIKLVIVLFPLINFNWTNLLLFSGVLSIIMGIYGAISETRIKRFFVYSSMGHVGFMLLGLATGKLYGIVASVVYLIIYIISAFIGWLILFLSTKKITYLTQLSGLSKNNFLLSLILAISVLSMSGIPPLAGFYVKFDILYELISAEYYGTVFVSLLLTVISFFYYLRVIKILYFEGTQIFKLQFKLWENHIQSIILSLFIFILIGFTIYIDTSIYLIIQQFF